MKKVLFIAPHLSTGGMPQYLYTLIEKLSTVHEVYCIEYRFIAPEYVVQRNRVIDKLGDRFVSLSGGMSLQAAIENIQPDVIHLQEMPEFFMDAADANWVYRESRPYFIVETSHDSSFLAQNKRWYPDHFALISEFQRIEFQKLNIPIDIVEYDIPNGIRVDRTTGLRELGLDPNLKHVLNVGLFTPRKNQAEIIEYARKLEGQPIQFHLVGNTAANFSNYWQPLLQNLPSNVKVWGERSDVERFYSCMDLFLFTSRGHNQDKETSPLVIREAIGYGIPSLIYNLPVYLGMYDTYDNIEYLDESADYNMTLILRELGLNSEINGFKTLDGEKDFKSLTFGNSMNDAISTYGEAAGMYWGTYIHNELERSGLTISPGDVFLDLGANIGVSARYAIERGAKVYSIEPDPIVSKLLTANCPTARIIQKAISAKSGETLSLYHWPHNPVRVGPTYTVDTISLKDVIDDTGENIIDYLKVDIEGFEESLFDELPNSYFKRIRQVFIEHHNPDTLDVMIRLLKAKNFRVNVEYGNGQNYIYATNDRFMFYKRRSFVIRYDNTANKIWYSTDRDVEGMTISVRDRDSRAVIWSTHHIYMPANQEYWLIPVPKGFIDFETDPHIGGLVVDVYSNDLLIWSEVIDIKPIASKPVITIDNDTEPVFMNYNEFFVDRIYDKYLAGETFNCVVDVGANTGMWIEYIWDKVPVKFGIYAIEPNTKAVNILRKSYGNTINILKKALVDKDGPLTFYIDKDNSLVSSISNYSARFDSSDMVDGISCKTLWGYIKEPIVDLMKIDIESAEYSLIESMDESDFTRINSFLIEYHIVGENTFDNQVTNLVNRLSRFGYTVNVEVMNDHGGYLFATKSRVVDTPTLPSRIKAVHLLLEDGNLPQQSASITNISEITRQLDIDYVQHWNLLYHDRPPVLRSRRPGDVVSHNNTDNVRAKDGALTPAHYGCYDSFRSAVLSEFDSDVDYLMIFEGDAYIQNTSEFYNALESMIKDLDESQNIGYISLGGRYDLDAGYLQSNELSEFNSNFIVTDKIIGCQCIIFPRRIRDELKLNLRTLPWDALDIYLNNMCDTKKIGMLVSKKTVVSQYNGRSVIDGKYKTFKEFPL